MTLHTPQSCVGHRVHLKEPEGTWSSRLLRSRAPCLSSVLNAESLYCCAGEKSTRDESVACAMLATQLDNFLGGEPVQHRQVQGYESQEFMALFSRGVSYKVRPPHSLFAGETLFCYWDSRHSSRIERQNENISEIQRFFISALVNW